MDPQFWSWIIPLDLQSFIMILGLAFLMEILYPFHKGILLTIHPVHTSYFMAKRLTRPFSSRLFGIIVNLTCILTHLLLYTVLMLLCYRISPIIWLFCAAYILKVSFSTRLLLELVYRVGKAVSMGRGELARKLAQHLVRRDVYKLDDEHLLSASIESLAESLVDGFVSPMFYYLLLGPIGALFQRVVNTIDGAIGYRTAELKDVGWFSAKLDTIINYIPARITALLIIISSPIISTSILRAWRIYLRDRNKTESMNAGHPMAAMAGVLGICLEKPGHYRLGDPTRPIEPGDVSKAIKVAVSSMVAFMVMAILTRLLLEVF